MSQNVTLTVDIDDRSFRRISTIVYEECGIVLNESKKGLLVSRLSRRLRELGSIGFVEYCAELERNNDERERLISLVTTNVTRFFREIHHFETLVAETLPPLMNKARKGEKIRIWSAGCSSGEEVYSIAMTVLDAIPDAERYDISILGTDIDSQELAKAKAGFYPRESVSTIENNLLRKYFNKCDPDCSNLRVAEALSKLVQFSQMNLHDPWRNLGLFDVIFCRNVVIYFDSESQIKLWGKFANTLKPGGSLFIGHSERVPREACPSLIPKSGTHYVRAA